MDILSMSKISIIGFHVGTSKICHNYPHLINLKKNDIKI